MRMPENAPMARMGTRWSGAACRIFVISAGVNTSTSSFLGIVLDRGDERNAGPTQFVAGGEETLPLMGLEVGHLLHSVLDSLRHEQGLLFRGGKVTEELAQPLAFPMVAEHEADSTGRRAPIDRDGYGAEVGHRHGFAFGAAFGLGPGGWKGGGKRGLLSCRQFVANGVHGGGRGVNPGAFFSP